MEDSRGIREEVKRLLDMRYSIGGELDRRTLAEDMLAFMYEDNVYRALIERNMTPTTDIVMLALYDMIPHMLNVKRNTLIKDEEIRRYFYGVYFEYTWENLVGIINEVNNRRYNAKGQEVATILVLPVKSSDIAPFEVVGKLTSKTLDNGDIVYYINGASYPAEIVTIISGGETR